MLGAIIVVSTLIGLIGRPRLKVPEGRWHPGVLLLVVTAAAYLNQVLFTVYIIRVHNGDTSFIARYLPDGWFAMADLRWLAERFPAPQLLAPTLLRVQAFLDLPFVVLAYLTVCRWFGPELYRRAAQLVWAVSASYTVTFVLIEWSLRNPYTTEDIIIRIVAGVVVAIVVPRLTGPGSGQVKSAKDLVLFMVSVGAMGVLVLIVYDTALLYNLGHFGHMLPRAAIVAAVLVVARLAARRTGDSVGPGTDTVIRTLGWFLGYFFVPALAIRYGLNFGVALLSAAAGLAIIVMAVFQGAREVLDTVTARRTWFVHMTIAAGAGLAAACLGYAASGGYPELRLLIAAAAGCMAVITLCAVIDLRTAYRR